MFILRSAINLYCYFMLLPVQLLLVKNETWSMFIQLTTWNNAYTMVLGLYPKDFDAEGPKV